MLKLSDSNWPHHSTQGKKGMAIPDPIPEFYFLDEIEADPVILPSEAATPVDLRWVQVEEFFCSRELAKNTRKAYERELQQFMSWTDQPWHILTVRDVDRYQQWLQTQRSPQGKALTPATLNRALSALQSFFKWLTAQGYISQNPTLTLKKPKAPVQQITALKAAEVKALFTALAFRGENEARDTALLRVLEQGLKVSQVSALNIQDYDGTQLQSQHAQSNRMVCTALIPEAREAIDAYLGWRSRRGLPTTPDSPLFLSKSNNSKGQRLSYWGFYKVIAELAELAQIEGCYPNRLHLSFAIQRMHKKGDEVASVPPVQQKSEFSFDSEGERSTEFE
jgi:integrase/recombinase XerD